MSLSEQPPSEGDSARGLQELTGGGPQSRSGGLGWNSAELLIIDEFVNRRVISADRALGVPAQLQLAETHRESIV